MEKIIIICFLGINIIIGLAQSVDFDISPENVAILNGDSFDIGCGKNDVTMLAIQWFNNAGESVASNDIPKPGYLVDYNSSAGTSLLTAPNANMTFSGTYKCTLTYVDNPTPTPSSFAEVVIFEQAKPVCQTESIVVEDDNVYSSCEVVYSGSWAPIMTWSIDNMDIPGASVTNETTDTLVKYSIVFKATAGLEGKQVVCETVFDVPDLPPDHATNTPASPVETYESDALNIHLPVREDRIELEHDVIYEGDDVTCSAPSIVPPAERVEWRDHNGTVIASGVLSATFTGAVGSYVYDCYVEHHVGEAPGELKSATAEFSFDVLATTTPPPTTTTVATTTSAATTGSTTTDNDDNPSGGLSGGVIAGIVIGAVALVVLVIVIIWIVWRKKKTSMEKDPPDSSKQQQMTPVHGDQVRSPDPFYMEDPGYSTVNHGMSPHSSPYSTYDSKPPQDNNVENLVYADLALDDKPRSRKPVQLYDNNYEPTDYAQIIRS